MNLWVELDKEPFSFEAQLSDFGPIKIIYFCVSLEEKVTLENPTKKRFKQKVRGHIKGRRYLKNLKAHVRNRQINFGVFPVCCWMETNTIHLQFAGNF